jgi:hypothetical protein
MTIRLLIAALAATATVSACGESEADKAQNTVCDARADIQSEVETLKGLPLSADSVSKATSSLRSIQSSLKTIAGAQPDLDGDRKQQVATAVQTFETQVKSAVTTAVQSGGGGDAAAAVRSAADQLATSFEKSFQRVDCS